VHIRYEHDFDPALERRRLRASGFRATPIGLVLAGVFLAAAVFAAISWHRSRNVVDLILAILLSGIATYYGYAPFEAERRALRERQLRHEGHTEVEITDEDVTAISPHTRHAIRWTLVEKVADRDHFWVGTTSVGGPAFAIPQELMAPDDVTELRVFMVERGLLPPEYKV
jgi:hypothetical protein